MYGRTLCGVSRIALLATGVIAMASLPARAEDQAASGAPAAAAAPTSTAMASPAMTGPLVANPSPWNVPLGPLGPVYVTGAISGLAFGQSNPAPTDHASRLDISNAQVAVQNTAGLVQFYAQAGAYSIPALGTAYVNTAKVPHLLYGYLPEGYLKLAPTDTFSVQAGKLPTLIGAEYTFTFENMNIERGLLWGQEPAISRGVQANYTAGPLAFSVSLNDGYYSNDYNWLTGSVAWTINETNTLSVVGGGNFDRSGVSTFATPVVLNNGEIVNVIYTYNAAPLTITPYLQFINVPSRPSLGWTKDAQSYGAAVLASYAFTDNISLAGRAEILGTTGSARDGSPNLLLGPGSTAWSLTLTPTYQYSVYFARAEGSFVQASSVPPGFGFGRRGTAKDQGRVLAEVGVVF
jgi:hypothetical protein